jgi:hypothetical protein
MLNNSVTFNEKPIEPAIGSEEFLTQMIKVLDIIIDRRPKGKLCKMES